MITALFVVSMLFAALLSLISFVQLLYLESLRLRTRDLPALEFFKDNLEDRLSSETERGALTFSLIKHSLLVLIGLTVVLGVTHRTANQAAAVLESAGAALSAMVIFAYILPQFLYRRSGARWVLPFVPLLRGLAFLMSPVVAVLRFCESLVELADESNGTVEPPTPAENIDALIDAGTEEGLIEEDDRKLIQSVVEFGDKRVREVMTPRPSIAAIAANRSLADLRQLVIHEQYSRIPVFENSIDDIVGFVHVRDVFELDDDARDGRDVRSVMRPIRFVPESKPVDDLMREMQQDGTHMVVVIDEYGNTAGVATMEDLVEVILGEIRDEHEPGSDFIEEGNGVFSVSGSFEIDRLDDMVSFHPPEGTESTTIGGLLSEWLGRVPGPGEWVERDGMRVEVLASTELRVERVRIKKSEEAVH